jgi:hypothetical protein
MRTTKTIRTASRQAIASTATATLTNPAALPTQACTGHIMPGFMNNLLSLGKLCDAGCYAFINKHTLHVYNNADTLVLRGDREPTGARLWRINLQQAYPPQPHPLLQLPRATAALAQHESPSQAPGCTPAVHPAIVEDYDEDEEYERTPPAPPCIPPTATPAAAPQPTQPTPPPTATGTHVNPRHNLATHKRTYDLPSTPALIQYLHATAGYPVKSTWLAAIKRGFYHSWPGLTYATAARYCPTADATIKGHMAQAQQNVRSTKLIQQPTEPAESLPPIGPTTPAIELLEVPLNKLFTDDTGRFPIRARSGNQYLMVAYHYASNAILIRPFASKADGHRIPAYMAIMARLKQSGKTVDIHILDNEASAAYRAAITASGCTYQLVPVDKNDNRSASTM